MRSDQSAFIHVLIAVYNRQKPFECMTLLSIDYCRYRINVSTCFDSKSGFVLQYRVNNTGACTGRVFMQKNAMPLIAIIGTVAVIVYGQLILVGECHPTR